MDSVYVYPAFNARYYSLYIEGLYRVFGRRRLKFTSQGFPSFGSDCLAIRVRPDDGGAERKIYIHSNDQPDLDSKGLAWCDVFGKVNLDRDQIPVEVGAKVLALGPTFAVRVWGPVLAELQGVANYFRTRPNCGSFRTHIANYRGQYASRFPEGAYRPSAARRGYIFYNAALWEREPENNGLRARFIEACRSLENIRFEGGLSPRVSVRGDPNFRPARFEPYFSRRYTPREYLDRTRASIVVLNNPAYVDCHSWRLAEYLAMGKAIISTPIVRAVPAPLVQGTHIHYVDGSVESFRSAILRISSDEEYRLHLEENAREYYEEYLAPESVVRRVLFRVERADGEVPLLEGHGDHAVMGRI